MHRRAVRDAVHFGDASMHPTALSSSARGAEGVPEEQRDRDAKRRGGGDPAVSRNLAGAPPPSFGWSPSPFRGGPLRPASLFPAPVPIVRRMNETVTPATPHAIPRGLFLLAIF